LNRNHNQVRNSRKGGHAGPQRRPSLFKRPNIRKWFPKKPAKKPAKTPERRRCDKCKKRFFQEQLFIHHRPEDIRRPGKDITEHMASDRFERMYRKKTKRPYYDRRKNIVIVCQSCYDVCAERDAESEEASAEEEYE
jgi:hypothetical protein